MMPRLPNIATGVECRRPEGDIVNQADLVETFRVFFEEEYRRLVIFLIRNGFPVEIARDSASEAMVEAHLSWVALETPAAWIRTVALRLAIKEVGRQRNTRIRLIEKGWDVMWDITVNPQKRVDDTAEMQQLLQLLPYKQRLHMTWHLDGFTAEETAAALGERLATVRSNVRHAKVRLKAEYDKQNGGR
jgi:RNA polymerase sigma-70 factor (ECF subfamily)